MNFKVLIEAVLFLIKKIVLKGILNPNFRPFSYELDKNRFLK